MENKLDIQFWCFPGWGICTLFLSPIVRHLQLVQNKMTNAQGGRGGGMARLELTELLIENVILPGKLSICIGNSMICSEFWHKYHK